MARCGGSTRFAAVGIISSVDPRTIDEVDR